MEFRPGGAAEVLVGLYVTDVKTGKVAKVLRKYELVKKK